MNLDYLMSLNGHGDVFGIWWNCHNADLRYVLNSWQFDKYVALTHFYRPVVWKAVARRSQCTHVNLFLLQILGQLQFNGHPSLVIAQVPDVFTKYGIHHRHDFILSTPDGIEV